ncbi:MAG TPA: hypothetical protein VFO85_08835, partial [Vicinamibacteria bacterium]|nr:hypothetical protein [Vicinamibacteria bacterium]
MSSRRPRRRERGVRPRAAAPPPASAGLFHSPWLGAAILFAAALAVRLLFWQATPGTEWPHNPFFKGDAVLWLQHALALERGRTFELDLPLRPPGAAYLVALVWDGRRESIDWLRAAWAIQGAAVPAVMFVALRRAFTPLVAWLASSLAVASTGLILLSSVLDNETPYLLLVLITLLLWEPLRARPSRGRLLAWSALHGLACLFRVEHLLFYVFCLALLLMASPAAAPAPPARTVAALRTAAVSAAVFLAVLIPWHVHAWRGVHRFNTVPPPPEGEATFRQLEERLGPMEWDPEARRRREEVPAFARTSAAVFVAATLAHRGERRVDASDFAILDEAFGYQPRPLARFPFVAAYGPLNFALANAPGAAGGFDRSRMRDPPPLAGGRESYPPQLVQGLPPEDLAFTYPPHLRLYNEGYGVGLRWIAAEPRAFARLAARKLAIFWQGAALG